MNIYIITLLEFLLISSSILFLFKFRKLIGLAPLYLFLGAVQYFQAFSGMLLSFKVFGDITIYPASVITFSAVLFAVLLIYVKESVYSARTLIVGIIISNFLLSALFGITYELVLATQNLNHIQSSIFLINYKNFIIGTILLLIDFVLLVVIYQFLILKINKKFYFFIIFISLLIVLIFDAFAFNIAIKYGAKDFVNSLTGHVIGKSLAALVFSSILYVYLKYTSNEKGDTAFSANQERDVFSIIKHKKKYLKLKAEKQQLEKNLTSLLETSLDNISDGFISLDTNWCYTYINKKAAELLGKSPESLIGKHIWSEFPDGVDRSFYNAYYKAVETQETLYFDDYYEPLDKWFENRIYPSPEGLTIYFTDITKQKNTEANNQMLLSLIETSDDFIGLASLKGEPLYLNDNGRQLVGLNKDEEMPASISAFFSEEYQERIVNEHLPVIFSHNRWNGDTHFKNFKTGDLIPIEMSGFLIKDTVTNNPIALGVVAKDITARNEAKERLIHSEQLFKRLTSKAPAGIYQTDTKGSCNYVNERWSQYAGISYEDAMGPGWAKTIHPDDEARILKEWEKYVSSGESELETDFRFLHKNNKVVWVSVKTVGTYDAQNNLNGYIGMAIDITEKKKAEQELIKSEELFKRLSANAPVAIFQTDKDGSCNYVNDEWLKYSGFTFEEALGFGWSNTIHPEDKDRVLNDWEKSTSLGIDFKLDCRILHKNKNITWVSAKAVGLYNANQVLYGYIGMLLDITERKEAEEKLINSEQLFRRLSANVPVGIFQTDNKGFCNYVNEGWMKYSELTFKESLGFGWSDAIHLEDKDRVVNEWKKAVDSGGELVSDFRLQNKNGNIKWVSSKTNTLYDPNNKLYGYLGTIVDVTDRKESEEKLIKSEKLFKELSSNAPVAIVKTTKDGSCSFVNEEFMRYTGLSFEKSMGLGWVDALHSNDKDRVLREWLEIIESEKDFISEFRFINKKGEITWVSTKVVGLFDENKVLNGYTGTCIDITERRNSEEKIKESQQYFENIINNIGDPVFVKDDQSRMILVNDALCSIFNLTRADIIGKTLAENIPMDKRKKFLSNDIKVLLTGEENVTEETVSLNKKDILTISTKKTRFIDTNKKKFIIGVIRDITNKKKVEEETRKAHQRLTTHLNNSPLAIIEWDKDFFITSWSVQAENIFGWEESEAIGKQLIDLNLVYEEDIPSTNTISNELRSGKVRSNKIINRNNTKKGKVIYCQWYNSVLQSSDGQLETVLSLIQDVTERMESEQNIKENEEKFAKAFESNVIGKAILNKEKTIVEVNEALANIVGFERENMLGKTAEEIVLFNLESPDNLENENKLWRHFSEKGYVSNMELKYLMQSGKELFILISLQALQLNNERHVLITVIDITEKKNIEEELVNHRNNLEELVELRTEEANSKNAELQRMNKLFVGRELRMKELKNIIKEMQLKNDN